MANFMGSCPRCGSVEIDTLGGINICEKCGYHIVLNEKGRVTQDENDRTQRVYDTVMAVIEKEARSEADFEKLAWRVFYGMSATPAACSVSPDEIAKNVAKIRRDRVIR